ncbi:MULTISPECIES: hypothetical protein [Butyricimonas]|uniref:Uncharacterized protein n=1 Tax=Butyricimonas hominis TaxID=2763032 RepID=A0ABR7CXR4_9BACT|nr:MULTISPECIES: hypothetical protein [Butyricimonas]MBC5620476.1 hypothetical protein [Butyricimonas hominis]MCB6970671.1 hypothetical protein [Butyricimonas synergistica]MCG4517385.1 hypothetical protein [Butyricimonas sp. DFI.6.44]
MNREDYLSQMKALEDIIIDARSQQDTLRQQYIDANKKFDVNERIRIITPGFRRVTPDEQGRTRIPEDVRYAYVEGYTIDSQGKITYLLAKETTTHRKAVAKTSYTEFDILEKIDPEALPVL